MCCIFHSNAVRIAVCISYKFQYRDIKTGIGHPATVWISLTRNVESIWSSITQDCNQWPKHEFANECYWLSDDSCVNTWRHDRAQARVNSKMEMELELKNFEQKELTNFEQKALDLEYFELKL